MLILLPTINPNRVRQSIQTLYILCIEHAAFIWMVGTSLAKHISTIPRVFMTARLANIKFLSATPGFACIRIMLIIGMATYAAYSFRPRASRHAFGVFLERVCVNQLWSTVIQAVREPTCEVVKIADLFGTGRSCAKALIDAVR
jgi:hypothetical protein